MLVTSYVNCAVLWMCVRYTIWWIYPPAFDCSVELVWYIFNRFMAMFWLYYNGIMEITGDLTSTEMIFFVQICHTLMLFFSLHLIKMFNVHLNKLKCHFFHQKLIFKKYEDPGNWMWHFAVAFQYRVSVHDDLWTCYYFYRGWSVHYVYRCNMI